VLHTGHLNLLEYAKTLGGFLLVALNDDSSIRNTKGSTRPINTLKDRIRMIEALKLADKVVYFNSDQELRNIMNLYSSTATEFIMVKGSDYKGKNVIGSEYCDKIEYVELNEKSTTSIVNR
jgi:D-beta-D-heptose 7-phosphate kinase/D-beta-D-heptose 1-phosphate adenosyltransferase